MKLYDRVPFSDVDITGGFWKNRQEINHRETVYSVLERFEETGRFRAFEFVPLEQGGVKPHFFWDSDIAKWIESVAYVIEKTPDPVLEKRADDVIDLIERHMDENGYFNLYFTTVEPENRFQKREYHELYCAGHLIEAAVAYAHATGKKKLLELMKRYVDCIEKAFVTERTAAFRSPGHEEIELALFKLYRATGEEKYKDLAMHFINVRGTVDAERGLYSQTHLPVREQTTAEGHCVRACYLYSAMADAAAETGDRQLFDACRTIFRNIYERRSYITGGIGSSRYGEAFTVDYDLPNSTAYAETCAAISLAFFAGRMQRFEPDPAYADIIERVFYNGMLAGVSLDGRSFFYEDPLEILHAERNRNRASDSPEVFASARRQEVFDCSCCPPNLSRMIASIADYMYTHDDRTVYVHQYMTGSAKFILDGKEVEIEQQTDYPMDGTICLTVRNMAGKELALRIPQWSHTFAVNDGARQKQPQDGYLRLSVDGDAFTVRLSLDIKPRPVFASPKVAADAGLVAVCMGPLVFCAESCDNGPYLRNDILTLPLRADISWENALGVPVLDALGYRMREPDNSALYTDAPVFEKTSVRLIPYYAFANREESDMLVWMRYFYHPADGSATKFIKKE